MVTQRSWFLVPARGGSRRLPRKNVLSLGGKPLIGHVLGTLTEKWNSDTVIVITDDDEIASIAARYAVRIFREPPTTGDRTLDDVALAVCRRLIDQGASINDILATIQPTCPFICAQTVEACIVCLTIAWRTCSRFRTIGICAGAAMKPAMPFRCTKRA